MIRAKKAGRKIASVILAAAILVTAAVPAWASSETMPFRDVKEGDWYYDAASFMYEKGLMNGTSPDEFSPDTFITKEMFVTMLGRLAEKEGAAIREEINPLVHLQDIRQSDYSRDYVYWADAVVSRRRSHRRGGAWIRIHSSRRNFITGSRTNGFSGNRRHI